MSLTCEILQIKTKKACLYTENKPISGCQRQGWRLGGIGEKSQKV